MSSEEGREDERLHGHELDQDVERRPGCVLERVADRVADHRRLVSFRSLGTQRLGMVRCTNLDIFLGVVPGSTTVGSRVTCLHAGDEGAGEEAGERLDAEEGAGEQRRQQHERPGGHHLPERRVGGDADAPGIVRRGEPLRQPRDGGELPAHLLHHLQRRAADAPHRHRREPVGEHRADDQPHEHLGAQHVDRRQPRPAHERAEQRQRHQRRRSDGEPLPDCSGGVSGGVQGVGSLPDPVAHAGHLGDPAGVVAYRPVGVDGEPGGDRAEHPKRGDGNAIDGGKREADIDGDGHGEHRHDDRLVPEGEPEDDVRRRAGPAGVGDVPHRAALPKLGGVNNCKTLITLYDTKSFFIIFIFSLKF
uniref:Uncharacterized protein n=1 Tax=Oryza brachyantha TaxID=4533 RepID=J3KZH6_ORYBR